MLPDPVWPGAGASGISSPYRMAPPPRDWACAAGSCTAAVICCLARAFCQGRSRSSCANQLVRRKERISESGAAAAGSERWRPRRKECPGRRPGWRLESRGAADSAGLGLRCVPSMTAGNGGRCCWLGRAPAVANADPGASRQARGDLSACLRGPAGADPPDGGECTARPHACGSPSALSGLGLPAAPGETHRAEPLPWRTAPRPGRAGYVCLGSGVPPGTDPSGGHPAPFWGKHVSGRSHPAGSPAPGDAGSRRSEMARSPKHLAGGWSVRQWVERASLLI